jgi:N-acetylmuramoyl-L-alanine amidase
MRNSTNNFARQWTLFFAVISLLLSNGLVWAETSINNIRVAKNGQVTRMVLDANKTPHYKIFTLNNPSRLVIDLADTRLATKINSATYANSDITNLRHATRKNNNLRIVLDLRQTTVAKSFVLPASQKGHYRLVIDIGTGKSASKVASSNPVRAKPEVTNSPGATTKTAAAPKLASNTKPHTATKVKAHPKKLREIIVAIDPGHGGKDPGAIGYAGTHEKEVVLQISNRLARLINAEPGMRAIMTRSSDRYLTLRGRIKHARDQKADLFISIHADAAENRKARGSSVYILSKNGASSEAAKILAQQQNQVDVIGGVSLEGRDEVLQKVLVDLSQTATIDASTNLAKYVINELSVLGKTKKHIEHAGFAVLKSPDIPSILVETAFISNVTDERKLRSSAHQQKLANSIFRGIVTYLNKYAPENTLIANRKDLELHTIRNGETLSDIANRYQVSVDSIRDINSLSSDNIRIGQKLVIPSV